MEKEIIEAFKKQAKTKGLWDKLGIYFSDASRIEYNLNDSKREYDILVYNVRTAIGAQVPVLNIEIESRSSKGVINQKNNSEYLLSFIFRTVNSTYSSKLESEKVYSTIVYNKSEFRYDTINVYAEYFMNKLKSKKNISELEVILNSNLSNKIKRGVLFFVNDLFSTPGLISHYELRHVFYEPNIRCVRALFGTEENRKGIFFFAYDGSKMVNNDSWIKNTCTKNRIKKYLSSKYQNGIAHYSNDDEIIILTNELNSNIINASKKADVSRIVLVSGERDSIFGTSAKRIEQLV